MTVTWSIASSIILYHRSMAYELCIYCSSHIYFSVTIVIITIKHQKYYFCYHYLLPPLPLLSYYFATKYFAADIKFLGVVELTTLLLILENILWLPLCRINKFGLNTLPSKTVVIPYTCGLSRANELYPERDEREVHDDGGPHASALAKGSEQRESGCGRPVARPSGRGASC